MVRQAGNKCIDEALDALGHRVAWRPDRRHVVEMTKSHALASPPPFTSLGLLVSTTAPLHPSRQ
jgi:hypothetical protein